MELDPLHGDNQTQAALHIFHAFVALAQEGRAGEPVYLELQIIAFPIEKLQVGFANLQGNIVTCDVLAAGDARNGDFHSKVLLAFRPAPVV